MRKRGGGSGAGVRGDLAVTSRVAEAESEVELAFVVGVWRRRAVPFVGESPGVERREDDGLRGARPELDTRSVVVDAESELFDPLGYGEGKVSERDVWIGIPPETGGVRGRSSLEGREISRRGAVGAGVMMARRLPSFDGVRGCASERAIPRRVVV